LERDRLDKLRFLLGSDILFGLWGFARWGGFFLRNRYRLPGRCSLFLGSSARRHR
jgi:hypothetical protein